MISKLNSTEDQADSAPCSAQTTVIKSVVLEYHYGTYDVQDLTKYGFTVAGSSLFDRLDNEGESNAKHDPKSGSITFPGGEQLEIMFRVRKSTPEQTTCSFHGLSLQAEEQLAQLLTALNRVGDENAELGKLSYDELASGKAGKDTAKKKDQPGAQRKVKTLVAIMLGLGMLGLVLVAALFLHTSSSLEISNASLVGNYLPINTDIDGRLVEVCFNEGDAVHKGDILLRLSNPEIESSQKQCLAELNTAKATVAVLQNRVTQAIKRINFAKNKLALDAQSAKAELLQAENSLKIAQSQVKRLEPFVGNAVTQLEFDQAKSQQSAEEALCQSIRFRLKSIELSRRAAKNNILIIGERIDDKLNDLNAELKIAEAVLLEKQNAYEQATIQCEQLVITAPRDGTVFANYRQPGQFLRAAEEAIALSYPGEVWAAGQVSAGTATKIRPGQLVRVSIPSLHWETTGTVASIGHRAMYAKGGYTAEFRGATATDVPIKVALTDLPEGVPSGMRLDMVVKLGFGIDWLDKMLGNVPEAQITKAKSSKHKTEKHLVDSPNGPQQPTPAISQQQRSQQKVARVSLK